MDEPLTVAEAFRFGFYSRCGELGLDHDQADAIAKAAVEKRAGPEQIPSALFDTFLRGAILTGAVGLGGGSLLGYGLHKATHPPFDPEEVRDQELTQAYDDAAREMRLRDEAAKKRPARRPSFRSI